MMTEDSDSLGDSPVRPDTASGIELTLAETLRVMDVATALRKEQIEVQKQFHLDETKRLLREQLLETAQVTGEDLTPAEIDVAIQQYFDNLHAFEEPKLGPAVLLAHLYIRRGLLLGLLAAAVLIVAFIWGAKGISAARTTMRAESLWRSVKRNQQTITALTSDQEAIEQASQQLQQADIARDELDLDRLQSLADESASLRELLEEDYEIRVVSKPGEQSAIDRYYEDESGKRVSGYYVIVEAINADGSLRKTKIRNRERDEEKVVTRWAEQVPKEVYDRLARDKLQDGVLDETLFAKKVRGETEAAVVMTDTDGRPLERQGQITSW